MTSALSAMRMRGEAQVEPKIGSNAFPFLLPFKKPRPFETTGGHRDRHSSADRSENGTLSDHPLSFFVPIQHHDGTSQPRQIPFFIKRRNRTTVYQPQLEVSDCSRSPPEPLPPCAMHWIFQRFSTIFLATLPLARIECGPTRVCPPPVL